MQRPSINLTFHGVGDHPRSLAAGEADVWLREDQFLRVLDIVAGVDNVHITFDDGNASDVEAVLPALRARGLRATFFVVAGRLGEPGFIDADGVCELENAGMAIGCHGMRHRRWRGLDEGALFEELVDAKRVLDHVTHKSLTEAACPFGNYDRRVLGALRHAGYERVYTSDGGAARADEWIQARNTVRQGDVDRLCAWIVSERRPSQPLRRRAKLAVKRWR